MNINSAKILFNYLKYSKDFFFDFNFEKYEKNIKFIDIGFCEFDHILNDFDFKKFTRNNLYLTEYEQENKILTNDIILENNSSKNILYEKLNIYLSFFFKLNNFFYYLKLIL
jgi:hypothetical protein